MPAGRRHPLHVAIVVGRRTGPGEGWGNADTVRAVARVLTEASVVCREVLIESPASVEDLLSLPNLFVVPNARTFHGADGSARSVLRLLEDTDVPFLGSDAEANAARSKRHMKAVLERNGLPTPRWLMLGEVTAADLGGLRLPVMVKPDASSNSFGVSRVEELASLLDMNVKPGEPTMVEEWVRVREFTVAVIGNAAQRRAFPLEVILRDDELFLTNAIKRDATRTMAPVVHAATSRRLGDLALAVAEAFHVLDWCRIDILEDGQEDLHVIDVNTLPGLLQRPRGPSYFPVCLQFGYGATYADTILTLVAVGLSRYGIPAPPAVQAAHTRLLAART